MEALIGNDNNSNKWLSTDKLLFTPNSQKSDYFMDSFLAELKHYSTKQTTKYCISVTT